MQTGGASGGGGGWPPIPSWRERLFNDGLLLSAADRFAAPVSAGHPHSVLIAEQVCLI